MIKKRNYQVEVSDQLLIFSFIFSRFLDSDVGDGYSLLRTEIIARIIASGSKNENHAEEIRKYLSAIEEMYEDSDEKEELNSMFLFLNKLSQVSEQILLISLLDYGSNLRLPSHCN